MLIKVNVNKVEVMQEEELNENEYNIHKLQFEFSEEYTEDLIKVAVFSKWDKHYKQIIENNECDISPEILAEPDTFLLGVYAYKTEGDELLLRYSPTPTKVYILEGSYVENAENSKPVTPSELDQYLEILEKSLKDYGIKYDQLKQTVESMQEDLQHKVDTGYFKGDSGLVTFEIVDGNLIANAESENTLDKYSIDEEGNLILEVGEDA